MLESSIKDKSILCIVAHPDDEVLGLGATIHHLVTQNGCKARVVILGEGITARDDNRSTGRRAEELKVHRSNIKQAADIIGYESVGVYDFPDNRFDTVSFLDIVKVIEKEKHDYQPDLIFTHHGGDLNLDHRKAFEAVMTATRPLASETVSAIISFETASATEWQASSNPFQFVANYFQEISEKDLLIKIKAMECYKYERRDYPHPRSPEALKIIAQSHGLRNGVEFAEPFHVVRIIEKLNK